MQVKFFPRSGTLANYPVEKYLVLKGMSEISLWKAHKFNFFIRSDARHRGASVQLCDGVRQVPAEAEEQGILLLLPERPTVRSHAKFGNM